MTTQPFDSYGQERAVWAKYVWLGGQFNRVVGEQPELAIEPIDLAERQLQARAVGEKAGDRSL